MSEPVHTVRERKQELRQRVQQIGRGEPGAGLITRGSILAADCPPEGPERADLFANGRSSIPEVDASPSRARPGRADNPLFSYLNIRFRIYNPRLPTLCSTPRSKPAPWGSI